MIRKINLFQNIFSENRYSQINENYILHLIEIYFLLLKYVALWMFTGTILVQYYFLFSS